MPLAGFEPTIPVFKRVKTFHALDRAAAVTSQKPTQLGPIVRASLCLRTENGGRVQSPERCSK
jgi:hypothetical protein